MIIYTTNEWSGYNRKNIRFWNEYELNGNVVTKYKCRRWKYFNGKENE